MIAHLSALVGLTGIPFANVIAPLVVWLVKREGNPFVNDQGKEALNFQITVTVAALILAVASIIPLVFCITIPLLLALVVVVLVFTILAGLKANEGQTYRYPFSVRLIT